MRKTKSNTLNVQINFQNKIITGKVKVPKKSEPDSPAKKKPPVPKLAETPKKAKKVKMAKH